MNVLNFDGGKIKINEQTKTVKKYTSVTEYQQLEEVIDYLKHCPIILECGIKVEATTIIDWNGEELITVFCQGLNLEHALRYSRNKKFWIKICKELLDKFQERGFLWGDIAPRNMVFDKFSNSIFIFDFERPLFIKDTNIEKKLFSGFFRRYAYEEFSCILTAHNQRLLFEDLLSENRDREFSIIQIISGRKKFLLQFYFGLKGIYSADELHFIEDIMSAVATPFIINKKMIVYPMFFIEKILQNRGTHDYSRIVTGLKECSNNAEKLYFLKSLIG